MLGRVGTAVVAGAVPALLAFRSGGYFPSQWGLLVLCLALLALVVVLVGERTQAGRLEVVLLAALVAFAGWSLLSVLWSPGPDEPVFAAERVLVYVAGAAALVVGLRRERIAWVLGGLLGGIAVVALWALETRLFEGDLGEAGDLLSGTRLVRPLGYANGLGALLALGFVLAVGLALWGGPAASVRAVAAALLVPLAAALYFTLSRGSVVALAVGLAVLLVRERRRETAVALGWLLAVPAVAVLLCLRSPLTRAGLGHGAARSAGHRLAAELVLLGLLSAGAALLVPRVTARAAPRLGWIAAALALVLVGGLVAAGPLRLVHHALQRVEAPPPATGTDLNRRVLSVSGSGRSAYWKVALHMVEREPLLGEGAGSYERWWLQERPVANAARNAHDLYLETLAELGPLGLALLLLALGLPLWAARRARGPIASTALAAYVVWLAHAALDWDWQIPAVTLPALACGAALLASARSGEERAYTIRSRVAAVVPLVALLAAALVMHVGNRAADSADRAIARGDDVAALAAARRARTWMPWAALPWQLAGEAQLATRDDRAARASLRRAARRDPASWSAWFDLATVTSGAEHRSALFRARELNPLAPELVALR